MTANHMKMKSHRFQRSGFFLWKGTVNLFLIGLEVDNDLLHCHLSGA